MNRYRLLFIGGLLLSLNIFSFPVWQRKVINHQRSEYNAGFQNWMIAQSENGWIYFANTDGLLEFDGVNWMLHPVPNSVVRSVKIIGQDIYIGGSTEFGFFSLNEKGLLTYHSLSHKTSNWGGEVWNIVDSSDRIYFISEYNIHIYDKKNKNITTINTRLKIDCSIFFNDCLHIGTSEGIFYLDSKNTIVPELLSTELRGEKVVSLLIFDNQLLVTTARKGLYLIGNNEIKKIVSAADNFIHNNQLFCTSASGSKIALGSVQNGVFIFDMNDQNYKETFNIGNGLNNNTVLSSFFDADNDLWLGLDKGISCIDMNSPLRPLFATLSPIGTGYCSSIYNGKYYWGTNQALYSMDSNGEYKLVKGTEGQIWSTNIIDNKLFAAGDNGITVITPNETYKINVPGAWNVQPLTADSEKLIVGTYSGFAILVKENGKWAFSHRAPDFTDSSRGFIEDEDTYTFWIVNINSQIQKVTYNPDFTQILRRKSYSIEDASIGSNIIFRYIDNNLVICTLNGIYKYSRITDSFTPYTQLETMLEGSKFYEFLYIDPYKNIWFASDKQLKMLPYENGTYIKQIYNWGLAEELINSYENIFRPSPSSAIISVDNAFTHIDLSQKENMVNKNIKTYIRNLINSRNDSIINYGKTDNVISLPYDLNSIKIHFAATDYTPISKIHYTYRLKGFDNEWSVPTSTTSKEYTNLVEGKYTFEVKAVINEEITSPVATISFTIMPPWYRTIYAYLFYSLIIVYLMYILYKKTIGKQKKIIFQKGEELIAQTKKHEEETKQKDKAILELQHEKLKNELHYKTQEMNGYILNLIRKNEMLEDVKKSALNIFKAIDEEKQQSVVKQKVTRLITQINNNIEHDIDFQVFKSNFDLVHKDFFRLLDEKFPELTRNDKILCAYLKINLSSKEIAPLLNISVRGVEVNRYRLRKKMNLDRDINLADFLQNLK